MDNQIRDIELSFTCHENWDSMAPANGGRHCDQCNKTVHDLTNSKAEEFIRILNENNGSICGRFRVDQVAAPIRVLPIWKKWLSAAMLLIGINLWSNHASAQSKPKQAKQKTRPVTPKTTAGELYTQETFMVPEPPSITPATDSINFIFGGVDETLPKYPGGPEMLMSFIASSIDHSKSKVPCRINVTFVIEVDGSMTDIKAAGRIADEGAAKEAIRVVSLLSRWSPGSSGGVVRSVQYTIPVMFK